MLKSKCKYTVGLAYVQIKTNWAALELYWLSKFTKIIKMYSPWLFLKSFRKLNSNITFKTILIKFGINMDYNVQMSKHNYTPHAGKQTPIRKNVLTKFRIENHCSCEHCSNREIVFVQMTVNLANIVNWC